MSKVALLGDLHFGVRSLNEHFFEFQREFIRYFLAECKKRHVSLIIQVGDFFDVRKSMNVKLLHYIRTEFTIDVEKAGIPWTIFPGNHDIYLKDSNDINSLIAFDQCSDLINVINEPSGIVLDNGEWFALPWIDAKIAENLPAILKQAKDHGAKYLVGHLELAGFPMYCNNIAEHGLNAELFKDFEQVWTGHYHTVSERQNIQYIGAPYHLTWGDVPDGDNRGFFVFDTQTKVKELVKNPDWMSMFSVFDYDPNVKYTVEQLSKDLGGKLVKIIVREKPGEKHYRDFIKLMNQVDTIEHRIIDETTVEAKAVEIKEADLQLDTATFFSNYIDKQDDGLFDKEAVKGIMKDVLTRAQTAV